MPAAYYNEIDPFAAQWLRNLIAAGHIAPGDVDERSIQDVPPDDLRNYTQCHFFAGLGAWSVALRRAGWDDARPIWTGSCPCQPFSSAGAGNGFDDARHLWPDFAWLIWQCQPAVIVGEQVASKAAGMWVDLVHADLETLGYTFGAVPFPAAGVGAPHIRDRLYWVANSDRSLGAQGGADVRGRANGGDAQSRPGLSGGGVFGGLADANGEQCAQFPHGKRQGQNPRPTHGGVAGELVDPVSFGLERVEHLSGGQPAMEPEQGSEPLSGRHESGPVNGFWGTADWLSCRDSKWRPVEPGSFPLAPGLATGVGRVQPGVRRLAISNRTGRLKGYGNALCMPAAQAFIECLI